MIRFLHQIENGKKIREPDGVRTHHPPWSSRML